LDLRFRDNLEGLNDSLRARPLHPIYMRAHGRLRVTPIVKNTTLLLFISKP
jgi:hypothetical protein